uniref:Peptidase S1 domain-containing protein n=1 Tax=Anopheles stephensi TaxID=30069 RepID=A0A182YCG0_ANOST
MKNDANTRVAEYLKKKSFADCSTRFYREIVWSLALPVAGWPVRLREFAHIAAIGWTAGSSRRWLCAGSLIWENFILTAAHCAADENNIPPDTARFGDINIISDDDDDFAQELKIIDIIRHPKHRFSSNYYDIALMKLERNVVVTDTVAPTCLWLDDEVRFPKLLAAGWGRTGYGEEQTDILLKVELTPVSKENCSDYYAGGDRKLRDGLVDHQLCAGDERMDTCPVSPVGSHYIVNFGWSNSTGPDRSKCFGTLIEPNIVVTLAECALSGEALPTQIILSDSNTIDIAEIVVHPLYDASFNPYYNNIAVVKLKTVAWIEPFCVWYGESIQDRKLFVSGEHLTPNENSTEPHHNTYLARVWKQSQDQCPLARRYSDSLPQGLLDEHLCYGNQPFFVPGACNSLPGSPIERFDNDYIYIHGIQLFGRDCGYGEPAVGVRLSAHKAWLESVLLPRSSPRNEGLVYIDSDLDVQDECKYADGTKGTCTPQQNCPAIHARLQSKEQLLFCGNTAVVCCPERATNLETKVIEDEFNECEARYRHLRTERQTNTSHMAEIGWQEAESVTYDCYGYLISTRGIVSSASCLLGKAKLPNIVRLGGLGTRGSSEIFRVEEFIFHPKYNRTTQQHNIAIVKLETAVEPSEHVFPGCLWQNVTHSPLEQLVLDYGNGYTVRQYDAIFPIYRSDCEMILNRSFDNPETVCMNPGLEKYRSIRHHFDLQYNFYRETLIPDHCYSAGSPIVWRHVIDAGVYVEYLVHVYSHGSCDSVTPRIVNRIAAYVDWFKYVLQ